MISLNLTIVIMVINFGVLYWLFRKFLLSPLVEFLDKRAEEIATERSDSKSDRAKAQDLLDEAKGRLKEARVEAGDMVKEARLEGKKEQDKIVDVLKSIDEKNAVEQLISIIKKGGDWV